MKQNSDFQFTTMSDFDFKRFRDLIYAESGINLISAKKTMLTSRLKKRVRSLGLDSFGEYFEYVSNGEGRNQEQIHMLDAVSTNKTDFFREPKHFEFMKSRALPDLIRSGHWNTHRRLNVWSAGCSSGEEPYTIAMVLAAFARENRSGDFEILASDISTRVLEIAEKGIYPKNAAAPVPVPLKQRFMMRGKGSKKDFCRVVPELRNHLRFQRINLNTADAFEIRTRMDIIFCRNVIIYFDRETQKKLFRKLYDQLVPGGYLFIGHSESLHGINDRFESVAVATYKKPAANNNG